MRILVTGASGFLGNNLVRMLIQDGHEVVAGVRISSDFRALDGLSVETLVVDLNNLSDVGRAVEGVDVVVHAAAMIHLGWTKIEDSRKANVETTRNLAIACRRKKIRLIYVSSVDSLAASTKDSAVDETQIASPKLACAYVVSKREAEQALLEEVSRGLDGLIVNPGFMVGPWDWKPSSGKMMVMLSKQPILFFAPRGGCSVVDVRDVADGIIKAITSGRAGERYILGGENMTYLELWKSMAKIMGKRGPRVAMRRPLAKTVGFVGDCVSKLLGREVELNSASIGLAQMFHWYRSDKAERELGYRITDVHVALQEAWAWFKQHGYVK
jgi:dihydroflavonol-4-reductase